jgi:hypothetical protein
MALDVYVMPLWRFKAGYFESPIEKTLGLRPKWVSPAGVLSPSYQFNRIKSSGARREVAAIVRQVSRENDCRIQWKDDGPVVMSEQAYYGFEALRAYALWLDHSDKLAKFDAPEDGDYYKHPIWQMSKGESKRCPQLAAHDCFGGYFLPCDFRQVVQVEPYEIRIFKFSNSVGSTLKLLEELKVVGEHLEIDGESCLENDAKTITFKRVDNLDVASDELFYVKFAFALLQRAAKLSHENNIPIIFCG